MNKMQQYNHFNLQHCGGLFWFRDCILPLTIGEQRKRYQRRLLSIYTCCAFILLLIFTDLRPPSESTAWDANFSILSNSGKMFLDQLTGRLSVGSISGCMEKTRNSTLHPLLLSIVYKISVKLNLIHK